MLHRTMCICYDDFQPRCVAHGMASSIAKEVATRLDGPVLHGRHYWHIKDLERHGVERMRARVTGSTEHLDVFARVYDTVLAALITPEQEAQEILDRMVKG